MALFDYVEVASSIREYQSISSKMDNLFNEFQILQKKLNSDDCWSGEAATYYKDEFNKLLKNLDDVTTSFKNIPNYISRIENNHKTIDMM